MQQDDNYWYIFFIINKFKAIRVQSFYSSIERIFVAFNQHLNLISDDKCSTKRKSRKLNFIYFLQQCSLTIGWLKIVSHSTIQQIVDEFFQRDKTDKVIKRKTINTAKISKLGGHWLIQDCSQYWTTPFCNNSNIMIIIIISKVIP